MPVERLSIVIAGGFIGDPGLEIGVGGVRVIVLVILAVIPVPTISGRLVKRPPFHKGDTLRGALA
jgi:hypothetical protein